VHNLGQTRSAQTRNHLLLTADTFVRTPLPGMKNCTAIVHASPAIGARFTQYTAEFEAGGELGATPLQRFLFVLEGELKVEVGGKQRKLGAGGYAYWPEGKAHRISAARICRAAVIEKPYQALPSVKPPQAIVSNEAAVDPHPL
jgi:(S)-ureidoglycine aminohydrolase